MQWTCSGQKSHTHTHISFSIFQNLSQDASEFAVHVKDEETLFPFFAVFRKFIEYIFCNAFWVIFEI